MKHDAILKLYPTVVIVRGDIAYDKDDNVVQYDEQLVAEEAQRMAYAPSRATEYPSIPQQLDLLWHDKNNGTNVWFDTIKAVKEKYPKA